MTRGTTPVNPPGRLVDLTEPGGPADELTVALFVARERAQAHGRRTPVIHALLAELGHPVRDLPADPDPAALEADEDLRVARQQRQAAASRARRAAAAEVGE